jgi:hypothetical protein
MRLAWVSPRAIFESSVANGRTGSSCSGLRIGEVGAARDLDSRRDPNSVSGVKCGRRRMESLRRLTAAVTTGASELAWRDGRDTAGAGVVTS